MSGFIERATTCWRRLPGVKWLVVFTAALLVFAWLYGPALAAEVVAPAQISDAVWLALIVAVPAIITGLVSGPVTLWLTNRGKTAERALEAQIKATERQEDRDERKAVAERLQRIAEKAAEAALAAENKIKAVAVQIDGLLVDRDKAKVAEGKKEEKLVGEATARTLAEGEQKGIEKERASVAASTTPVIPADLTGPTK